MASPLILQAMWLFLVSAISAGLDTRSVQREFPQLADVIYSICGLHNIDFTVSQPCPYSLFGMAYAFTECGVVHQSDYSNFQSCVSSCSSSHNCEAACADPEVKNENCLANCHTVAACIDSAAATAKGQTSAYSELRDCFTAEAPPSAVIAAPAASPAPAPALAAASAAALLSTHAMLHAAPWREFHNAKLPVFSVPGAPAPAGPASLAEAMPASPAAAGVSVHNIRKGIVSAEEGFVLPQCVCSSSGIVRGVNTGQSGCAKHGKEANANVEAYCYVEGGFECGGAMPSDNYQGLYWVGCEKPNLNLLYPPTCEILTRSSAKLFDVPAALGLKVPPPSFEATKRNMAPLPTEANPLEDMTHGLATWSEPLPPVWHTARDNYFMDGAFQKKPMMLAPAPATAAWTIIARAPAPVAAALVEEVASSTSAKLRGLQRH